ncbi:hypothetical protein NF98_13490 [Salmonella enterica subsp. enterica serovar Rubislaw]|nr:hypothetical protein [Salmonella enterica]EBL5122728.1 hypothetical protein [Salmonella enterica subsp. enterica serovar Rubislaw]
MISTQIQNASNVIALTRSFILLASVLTDEQRTILLSGLEYYSEYDYKSSIPETSPLKPETRSALDAEIKECFKKIISEITLACEKQ